VKIFTLKANENWICDRFAEEWIKYNGDLNEPDPRKADIIWILSSWQWKNIPLSLLANKKIVVTIHHIVPEKFSKQKYTDFKELEKFVDVYHVPSQKSKKQVEALTEKTIKEIPFWVNQDLWFVLNKEETRKKYGFEKDSFLIGSFQRDTEGNDLKSPKLEKGPDLFCDYVIEESKKRNDLKIILGGWRRQYVIKRLQENNIPFEYFELCDSTTLNELYNCLDLYVVSARYEGGPQAIVECAITKTPIISTDVGLASSILSSESIYSPEEETEAKPNIEHAYNNVLRYVIPQGFEAFIKMFDEVVNENIF